jgi:tetratricopeptide (TPR) repeat protein
MFFSVTVARAGCILFAAFMIGCDYSGPVREESLGGTLREGQRPLTTKKASTASGKTANAFRSGDERKAILDSSITLIQKAALQPGGQNFALAVQKLNQYFEGTNPAEYQLDSASREFLRTQFPADLLNSLQDPTWNQRDTRHLEDCMMYYGIATRVAGTGENLVRVRRVFDWVVRNIQLVPAGALAAPQMGQAFARPYDVLLRGMATESEGYWAERTWLFMVLCRQLGLDAGLITYTKGNVLEPLVQVNSALDKDSALVKARRRGKVPVIWICTVLIGDQAYLFDARLGKEVPGPGGQGVATVAQALADPAILEQMNLPSLIPYATSRASLLASPTKLGILLDSSQGYSSPKMRLLQRELAGSNRTILYADPAEQRDNFQRVLGDRCGTVSFWSLPLEVEVRLFNDSKFNSATKFALTFFGPEFPLVYARVKQLRGELPEAIEDMVRFRFAENFPMVNNKKVAIPPQMQKGLDIYASYFLALAHLEKNNLDQAELLFRKTMELIPENVAGQPFFSMFRWGASSNLARIYEAKNQPDRAIAEYTRANPTFQYIGNMLRARDLVWRQPIANLPSAIAPVATKD